MAIFITPADKRKAALLDEDAEPGEANPKTVEAITRWEVVRGPTRLAHRPHPEPDRSGDQSGHPRSRTRLSGEVDRPGGRGDQGLPDLAR